MLWKIVIPNRAGGQAVGAQELLAGLQPLAAPAELRLAEIPMDSEAFAAFYERSARPLWAYLARVSADPALADDLMQESFVRFLCVDRPELSLADGEVAARRYLFRIGTNLLKDHWRRPSSQSIEELPEELFARPERASLTDSEAMLGPALAQLRPRDRQLLWLAHAEGYSHKEIAQITGLASASIRLLLFRARFKIARLLTAQTAHGARLQTPADGSAVSPGATPLRRQP